MRQESVLMVGSGGHARVLADILHLSNGLRLVGVIDDFEMAGTPALGVEILGTCEDLPRIMRQLECCRVVLAVGHNARRLDLAARIESLCNDVVWQSLLHPAAVLAGDAVVGEGAVIMAGAIVNAGAQIGRHCLINTSAIVEHDCKLGDGSSVGPGGVLGGNVRLGVGAIVALGAGVINALELGEHALLGAGATAVRDLPAYAVALGVPARTTRFRDAGEEYL
ncbi:sugar O-acyltransferase, sialic acid O-acetyltransferase NeuD family [Pseudomonas pohangensis]|uniref:Sugar O-acyltransferase, sialic acid O-acetyltransferase NeuD family n=2 Tax=Pseudomonas pohangensis TaxID=364197 RepID=A0A1H2H9Y9_9PSED|nr:sugar O-acyltransferase, sialic acid O-acetyltransferase NeuD family [Pseudomonas pohangensis]